MGVMCKEGKGLIEAKGHLVLVPHFCAQAPCRVIQSLVCAHGGGERTIDRGWACAGGARGPSELPPSPQTTPILTPPCWRYLNGRPGKGISGAPEGGLQHPQTKSGPLRPYPVEKERAAQLLDRHLCTRRLAPLAGRCRSMATAEAASSGSQGISSPGFRLPPQAAEHAPSGTWPNRVPVVQQGPCSHRRRAE